MKKDLVIALIEDNRLKEALDVLKKETKGTYLYNQVILLSANYEDNLKLEITGMEDYSVRSQKHAQLVNALLLIVDKVSELKSESSPITIPDIKIPVIDNKQLKIASMSLGLIAVLMGLVYFINNIDWHQQTPQLYDLKIIVVKDNSNDLFTEGGKIKVKIEDKEVKTVDLSSEGKAYINALAVDLKNKKVSVQFEDTSFYNLVNPEITDTNHIRTLKATAKIQTVLFSGRVLHYNKLPVKNAKLVFGDNIATAMTNENGEYTVYLPKKIVEKSVELSVIQTDGRVNRNKIFMDEKILKERIVD